MAILVGLHVAALFESNKYKCFNAPAQSTHGPYIYVAEELGAGGDGQRSTQTSWEAILSTCYTRGTPDQVSWAETVWSSWLSGRFVSAIDKRKLFSSCNFH